MYLYPVWSSEKFFWLIGATDLAIEKFESAGVGDYADGEGKGKTSEFIISILWGSWGTVPSSPWGFIGTSEFGIGCSIILDLSVDAFRAISSEGAFTSSDVIYCDLTTIFGETHTFFPDTEDIFSSSTFDKILDWSILDMLKRSA